MKPEVLPVHRDRALWPILVAMLLFGGVCFITGMRIADVHGTEQPEPPRAAPSKSCGCNDSVNVAVQTAPGDVRSSPSNDTFDTTAGALNISASGPQRSSIVEDPHPIGEPPESGELVFSTPWSAVPFCTFDYSTTALHYRCVRSDDGGMHVARRR